MALEKQKLIIYLLIILVVIYFLTSKEGFGMPDSKYNYFVRKCGQVEGFGMPDSRSNYFPRSCGTPNTNTGVSSSGDKLEGFACPCAARMNCPYYRLANGYQEYEDFGSNQPSSNNVTYNFKGTIKSGLTNFLWINDDGSLSLNKQGQYTKPLEYLYPSPEEKIIGYRVVVKIGYGDNYVYTNDLPKEGQPVILTMVPKSAVITTINKPGNYTGNIPKGTQLGIDNGNKLLYAYHNGMRYYVSPDLKWTTDKTKAGKFELVPMNFS